MRAHLRQVVAALALVFAIGGIATATVSHSATAAPPSTIKYGPGHCKIIIHIIPGQVKHGQPFKVIVTGNCKHRHFDVTVHSTPVLIGTFMTDGNGNASPTFVLPLNTSDGAHLIVAADAEGDSATAQIILEGTAAASPTTTVAAASHPLAFTGAEVAGISSAGAALVCVGGLVVLASRKRKNRART